jgi:uncharacterized protein
MKLDSVAVFFNKLETIAIIGVSHDQNKPSHLIYKDLKKKSYSVVPVNPHATSIDEDICYSHVSLLPDNIRKAVIVTKPEFTDEILHQISKTQISTVWIQYMSNTKDSVEIAQKYGLNVIYNRCVYMFAEPVRGIHAFHRGIMKFFRAL